MFLAGCNELETANLLPLVIYQPATTGLETSVWSLRDPTATSELSYWHK